MNSGFINIYPNPTHGIVSVILPENPSISYIECFDTFGNRIYYSQVTKNEINVDLSNKQDGLYIFKIYFSNTIYYFKIVLLK